MYSYMWIYCGHTNCICVYKHTLKGTTALPLNLCAYRYALGMNLCLWGVSDFCSNVHADMHHTKHMCRGAYSLLCACPHTKEGSKSSKNEKLWLLGNFHSCPRRGREMPVIVMAVTMWQIMRMGTLPRRLGWTSSVLTPATSWTFSLGTPSWCHA